MAVDHDPARRRRADAERSIAAVLDAAVDVLAERPDASMSQIAAAAGVTRQTVYAHYGSREALLVAVTERAMAETLAAIDGARPDDGPAGPALERLIDAWWGRLARHVRVLEALAVVYPTPAAIHDLHEPVLARLEALVRRGQADGTFDDGVPTAWLAASFLGLVHTASDEVAAGRLTPDDARAALARTLPRFFGAAR